jgi:hypothetical protein
MNGKEFGRCRSGLEDNINANIKEYMASVSAWVPQVQDKLEIQWHINTIRKSGN